MRQKKPAFELAQVFAVFGGLLIIVAGIFILTGSIDRRAVSLDSIAKSAVFGLLGVGLGCAAIFGSREVKSPLWDIGLLVIGVISYEYVGGFFWQLGPVLVVLAGLIGILNRLL